MAAKKEVVSKVAVQKEVKAPKVAKAPVEPKFSALIRIPTIMYGYMEVQAKGTPEELMRVHAKFCNAYSALAKTAIKDVEVKVSEDQKTATASVVETAEAKEAPLAPKSESRVDEMFKKKGEESTQQKHVVMRSKSWILAEERLNNIKDPNALEVLAGQIKSSVKMPEAEKPEFLKLISEKEQEITDTLLVD